MNDDAKVPAVINTGLSVLAQRFPVMSPETAKELREVLDANLGPRGLSQQRLDRIKVPSGETRVWSVPGLNGDEPLKEIGGLIVAWRDARLYWRVPFDQRGKSKTPPDCLSNDGFWGEGDPGGDCIKCPFNIYGSDPKGGRGKACKEVKQLLLLREEHILPQVITIPPTSIKNCEQYLGRLGNLAIPYWAVVTTLKLERTANPDGIEYSRVAFSAGDRLNPAERAALKPYQEQMMAMLKPLVVESDDYVVVEDPK